MSNSTKPAQATRSKGFFSQLIAFFRSLIRSIMSIFSSRPTRILAKPKAAKVGVAVCSSGPVDPLIFFTTVTLTFDGLLTSYTYSTALGFANVINPIALTGTPTLTQDVDNNQTAVVFQMSGDPFNAESVDTATDVYLDNSDTNNENVQFGYLNTGTCK